MKYNMVKLKELCTVNQGLQIPISKRYKEPGENRYFYITVQFLKDNGENYYIENPPKSVTCTEDEILVVRTGNTGQVITGVAGCFHNNFFKVTPNEKIYFKYLYYALNNKKMHDAMLNAASGTTIPDLKHSSFYDLEIPLPEISIQKKIAKILDNICDKLKLNNEINNNLLELSIGKIQNTSFDNYENLSDLSEIISKGTTPTTGDMKQFENRNIKFIKVRDFTGYYINKKELEFIPKEIHEGKLKRSILKENDLLISIAGTLGKVAYVDSELDNSNTNQAVAFIRLKDILNMGYLYFYLQTKKVQMEINEKQVHAVQPNFSLRMLGQIEVPILMDDEKKKYNDILNVIKNNVHQNEKLEQLRDTLLPKLMNGKIDLDNIEI